MKDYLFQFRDQAFNGALSLYKRIFLPFLGLHVLTGLTSTLITAPLWLKFMGWGFEDLALIQENMNEMSQNIGNGSDPAEALKWITERMQPAYLLPALLSSLLILPWSVFLYLRLNDGEIRHGKRRIGEVLASSFSVSTLRLLGFSLIYYLFVLACFFLLALVSGILMGISKALGILLSFFGFIALLIFLARFLIGPAAIVHGKMSISEAFGYSYAHINMKRSAMLGLMMLLVLLVMTMLGSLAPVITGSLLKPGQTDPQLYFIAGQFISSLLGAVTSGFVFSGMSAIYFRYSVDVVQNEEHLSEPLSNSEAGNQNNG